MTVASPARPRLRDDQRPDADLVARARTGDEGAYATLVGRHQAAVTAVARRRLGDQGDPADVVQETFLAAWSHLDSLREPDRLRPWLLQIARRAAIDHGRRHRRTPVEFDDEHLASVADEGPALDELVALAELAERLGVALSGLSRRDAAAISLATHLGLGPDEIGAALGVTPGNAKVILHRARRRLRAAVDPGPH